MFYVLRLFSHFNMGIIDAIRKVAPTKVLQIIMATQRVYFSGEI